MARNQPFDFSDDDLGIASGTGHMSDAEFSETGSVDLTAMGDDLTGDAARRQNGARSGAPGPAAQQATTQSRSSAGRADTPLSMHHKRGNEPR